MPAARSTWDGDDWAAALERRLPSLGHRNWVVVADAAYPEQSGGGIETVYVGGDHLAAVRTVLAAIGRSAHVRAVPWTDAELGRVSEADAPGIGEVRQALAETLADSRPRSAPHGDIIGQLDRVAETFSVLVLKTDMTLPYTSVFIELDCGYWDEEAEQRLRAALREEAR